MDYRGYQSYKQQSVNTMTKGEMLILLYDEIVKRLTRADFALQKQDFVVFTQSVDRATDIVRYLIETLNFEYSVSRDLKRMYDYFLFELARLQAGRNPSIIVELQGLVKELREAYATASQQSGV